MEIKFNGVHYSMLKEGRVNGTALRITSVPTGVQLHVLDGKRTSKGYIMLPSNPDQLEAIANAFLEQAKELRGPVPEPVVVREPVKPKAEPKKEEPKVETKQEPEPKKEPVKKDEPEVKEDESSESEPANMS
jgi:outer membrane biosynthesis protein TonB